MRVLALLRQLNESERITWSGKFRPNLNNMKIFPRPIDNTLPIWRAVGGGQASAGNIFILFKLGLNFPDQVIRSDSFN